MQVKRWGAEILEEEKVRFTVWAPLADRVDLIIKERKNPVQLEKKEKGYHEIILSDIAEGALYKFFLNGKDIFPDPASKYQPEGVHSWSQLVNTNSFAWEDENFEAAPLSEMIIYEIHTGTFSEKGTFEGIADKLDHLLELGINTIEILPVAQFPGERNWGYDGVYPFAVQKSYGGPKELQKLVNTCHKKGISVILDVVYNHLGPEGNYLSVFGPYFTEKYHTPWGSALNFDDKYSDAVRQFFLQNALYWLEEFHIDGLRLDAIHEIIDRGANHLLRELSQKVDLLEEKTGKKYTLIAESDLNDVKIIDRYEKGGFGIDAQWVDDFHHSLHTLITGEKSGYYKDFGSISDFEKSFRQAFIYDGKYSEFRKRTVGNSPKEISPEKFVVCIQNHDQVGNRMLGDRLSTIVSAEKLKLGAALLLISPFTPMLYMGEEFAEDKPFLYFVDHGDKDLIKAVQEGRKREFKYFNDHEGEFPDPQSEETFRKSKLNWNFEKDASKNTIFQFYKELIRLRKKGVFLTFRKGNISTETSEEEKTLKIIARDNTEQLFAVVNFGERSQKIAFPDKFKTPDLIFNSAAKKWNGPDENSGRETNETIVFPASVKIFRG